MSGIVAFYRTKTFDIYGAEFILSHTELALYFYMSRGFENLANLSIIQQLQTLDHLVVTTGTTEGDALISE